MQCYALTRTRPGGVRNYVLVAAADPARSTLQHDAPSSNNTNKSRPRNSLGGRSSQTTATIRLQPRSARPPPSHAHGHRDRHTTTSMSTTVHINFGSTNSSRDVSHGPAYTTPSGHGTVDAKASAARTPMPPATSIDATTCPTLSPSIVSRVVFAKHAGSCLPRHGVHAVSFCTLCRCCMSPNRH